MRCSFHEKTNEFCVLLIWIYVFFCGMKIEVGGIMNEDEEYVGVDGCGSNECGIVSS